MMDPQTHNLNAVRGEFVSLIVGYGVNVDASDVLACIRKTIWQDDYAAKFNIEVIHDDLAQGEACKIKLVLDTNLLEAGVYVWDLFLWGGSRPIKCLVKGKLTVSEGVSNRGK